MPLALSGPLAAYRERAVVVGVSGGADSVALLRALLLVGARPVVAHLDHALRPGSADDAAWVAALAARLGVRAEGVRVDVAGVASRRGWNLEDAARRVRYDFLSRVARQSGAGFILTAHTRRDQAETVLVGLLRGEAVLSGIPAARGKVRRPWLEVGRPEVEAFLHALRQDWRDDPSNADPAYTRAWLRREVMPRLTARFPGLEGSLARLARQQGQDNEALGALAAGVTAHVPRETLAPAVLRRLVRQELRAAGLDVHAGQVGRLAEALGSGETAHLTLPRGADVTVTGGRLFSGPQGYRSPAFPLPAGWALRTRQDGDRIRLLGGTRKLSDVFTDLRVPRADRDRVPVLVSADRAEGDAVPWKESVQWIGLTPPVWAVGAREHAGQPEDPLHAAMGEALALAREAAGSREVPVGAVVLGPDGALVGRGRNTSRADGDMTRHAELAALWGAAATLGTPYLTGCTLVVTLEPCPMCLGAALEARVGHIVFGARNVKAGALGGVTDLLAHRWGHAPQVTGGVRAPEAARLLRETFRTLRRASPAGSHRESGHREGPDHPEGL
nr:tRNA lysidine(34) synthetase TilS [Deinococcus koreensis]